MKPYYLHGISIGGYRAFIGSGNNVFGPLGKINLLVGRNNSGKSNFLRFIYKHLNYVLNSNDQSRSEDRESRFTELDVPHVGQQELTVEIALSLNSPQFTDLKKRLGERPNGPKLLVLLEKLMSTSGFSRRDSAIWFAYKAPRQNDRLELTAAIPETVKKALTQEEWLQLWTALTNQSGGDFNVHWVPETLKALSRIHSTKYAVHFIPAIRFIGSPENVNFDFSGNGIIAELGRLQNPTIKERELRKNFDKINEFLREVTNCDDAEIEITHDKKQLLVRMDGKILPIENLGTGIHEVVIIAAACTVYESCIFCIEEPELHLNPVLQKRLIRYLANTENQYIISTHSPHFIDGANANVFHVSIRNGLSNTTLASTETSRHGICMDLGIRASDIMQSNCVVWVEGPSDRIIVRHWISMTAPELEEGIHYSIMFYGGRLLSHLTVDDDAVGDFIFLGHMNRRSAIIMDSDRASIEGGINNTKTRVVSEFSRTSGFCWITAGREVENYYEPESLESAICEIYGEGAKPVALGEYDHVWRYLDAAGKEKDADKVKLARKVAEKSMGNRLDLQDKVKELVAYIKDSN